MENERISKDEEKLKRAGKDSMTHLQFYFL